MGTLLSVSESEWSRFRSQGVVGPLTTFYGGPSAVGPHLHVPKQSLMRIDSCAGINRRIPVEELLGRLPRIGFGPNPRQCSLSAPLLFAVHLDLWFISPVPVFLHFFSVRHPVLVFCFRRPLGPDPFFSPRDSGWRLNVVPFFHYPPNSL